MQILSLEQLARSHAAQNNRDIIVIQGLNTWSTAIDMADTQKALPFLPPFEENEGVYIDGAAICICNTSTERGEAMAQIEALCCNIPVIFLYGYCQHMLFDPAQFMQTPVYRSVRIL